MTDKNILGRPITGDLGDVSFRQPTPQLGPEEFIKMFDEFFEAHPECKFIRWGQGTPGFNDGEPCTFDIHETRFGFSDPDEDSEDDEDYDTDYGDVTYTTSNLRSFVWDEERIPGSYNQKWHYEFDKTFNGVLFTEDLVLQYEDFSVGDEFEEVLLKNFGDPAEVTATREGFHVEYFDIGY